MPLGDHLTDDFWLITDNRAVDRVLVMHYATDGQYLGATERPDLADRGRAHPRCAVGGGRAVRAVVVPTHRTPPRRPGRIIAVRGNDAPAGLHGLAGHLRALRESTRPRISQTAAARAIKAGQNKISRAESGQWLLEPPQVATLARLYGAEPGEVRQLVAWAEAPAPTITDSRLIFQRGTASYQQRVLRVEQASELVRSYQPAIVLGVLQTEAYAGVLFGGDAASVAARRQRNRMLLDDPARRWMLIQTEGSLMWNLGGATVMAAQLDAMITASHRPNVDLRIITRDRPATFVALHGFHLYDHHAVHVGTLTATSLTSDPRDVGQYTNHFDRLADIAVTGDHARAVLERIADDYRNDVS